MAIGMCALMRPGDDSFLKTGLIVRKLMRTLLYNTLGKHRDRLKNRLGSIQYMEIT